MSTTTQSTEQGGRGAARDCVYPLKPEVRTEFQEWLKQKQQQEDFGHSYTHKKARKRYARAKDVGRYFVQEYDEFSTVFITYCNGVRDTDENIVENAESFYPRKIVRKRRKILKDLGAYDEYAGVSLLAPKSGAEVPHPSAPNGEPYTHAHDFLWIPTTEVSEEDFAPLVEEYNDKVEDYSVSEAISVQHHTSDDVTTPFSSETDTQRGATTALPQELGRNLPLLDLSYEQGRYDARDAPTYVEKWCAALRLGKDETTDTKGIRRFRTLGRFSEYADEMKRRREEDSEEPEVPHPSAPQEDTPSTKKSNTDKQTSSQSTPKGSTVGNGESPASGSNQGTGKCAAEPDTILSEPEQTFVDKYVQKVGKMSSERITEAIENNKSELSRKTERIRPQVLINHIQYRL
jgi:hypothetical protein